MTRFTLNLTPRAEAALTEITTVQECDKTAAVNRALIDYASRLGDGSDLTGEAERIVRILSDARLSSLQAAFRKLGWPLKFVLAEEPATAVPLGRDVSDGGHHG